MNIDAEVGRERAADAGDVRVLHPLRLHAGPTGKGEGRGVHAAAAIDVETTSLDARTGKIIELAIRRFAYDRDGVITGLDDAYNWREDPGEPLTDDIRALTGLTDADLVGQRIDTDVATDLLRSCSFVVAHNSQFDRTWVENRLPDARGLRWCCSMRQVDWRARGFDNRVLGYLLVQDGFYHCGHNAAADVDALIQLLRHEDVDGRTALAEMIERGSEPSWIVRARGAAFDMKDRLRERGYRWDADPQRKVWWREVPDQQLVDEQLWLAANVYAPDARAQRISPELVRITAENRFL
ncbi:3'-5' exonuclease [uncultured Sphingomonas sp.]|uniref:3'-5' exonuclease n=1 Tax=uncultured Sphingomonas sp. TaxID=158754 RepID=UPI00261E9AB2|nr:3'-5' exonuclease [uncultured Sphingomonas sp.]